jgi:hypothetical protein
MDSSLNPITKVMGFRGHPYGKFIPSTEHPRYVDLAHILQPLGHPGGVVGQECCTSWRMTRQIARFGKIVTKCPIQFPYVFFEIWESIENIRFFSWECHGTNVIMMNMNGCGEKKHHQTNLICQQVTSRHRISIQTWHSGNWKRKTWGMLPTNMGRPFKPLRKPKPRSSLPIHIRSTPWQRNGQFNNGHIKKHPNSSCHMWTNGRKNTLI